MVKKIEPLEKIRDEIDHIDSEIQQLLVERVEKIKEIVRIKQQENETCFYRPERESNILKKIMSRNCGNLPPTEMAKIFREIMSACLALQKPMQIAFLGPEGTYSELAAIKHFGSALNKIFCDSIHDVFQAVVNKQADYGVVPIENSITGLIELSLYELIDSSLTICGEASLGIHHCLLQATKADGPINRIYAHQQSFGQCQQWIKKNFPNAELISVNSNAFAATKAANEKNTAAIASANCAEKYSLQIIASDIADQPNNKTRFLIIGHQRPEASGDDRTSLLITAHDAPGTLEKLINPLASNKINITMILSKPANQQRDTYYFFLDLDCHQDEARFIRAQHELTNYPLELKILGSYPKAVL